MSLAAAGQDGNGLQLISWANFFPCVLEQSLRLLFVLPLRESLGVDVLGASGVREEVTITIIISPFRARGRTVFQLNSYNQIHFRV